MAKSKRARVVRESREFDLARITHALQPPRQSPNAYSWDLERIRAARDSQLVGKFKLPAQLATSQKTDDSIYTALRNRLSPTRSLPVEVTSSGKSARAERAATEGASLFGHSGVGVRSEVVSTIHEQLADHGVAFGLCTHTPRDDGTRVDVALSSWPIEHVEWSTHDCAYVTQTRDGGREVIQHGDGRWCIFSQVDHEPWRWGAIVATALIWYDRAFGVRDRGRASTSHGNAKMLGELPDGIGIDSPEGLAFLELLRTMHEALPYGIHPYGSKVQMLTNTSSSWQIFQEIINGRARNAAQVYLGHDSGTSSVGGNYIKDGRLFNITVDIVEGDLGALSRGIREGVIEPWAAINFGDSTYAPTRRWLMPDADEDARLDTAAKRRAGFNAALAGTRDAGIPIDQPLVNVLAAEFGVAAPLMPEVSSSSADLFQYDLELGIVTVNEARARKGLPAVAWGDVTVPSQATDLEVDVVEAEAEATDASPSGPVAPTQALRRARPKKPRASRRS